MMCADMIAHEMNRLDVVANLRIQLFQKGDEFLLTLTGVTLPKTVPERVSNAANKFKAPLRLYSCSSRLGMFPG